MDFDVSIGSESGPSLLDLLRVAESMNDDSV